MGFGKLSTSLTPDVKKTVSELNDFAVSLAGSQTGFDLSQVFHLCTVLQLVQLKSVQTD